MQPRRNEIGRARKVKMKYLKLVFLISVLLAFATMMASAQDVDECVRDNDLFYYIVGPFSIFLLIAALFFCHQILRGEYELNANHRVHFLVLIFSLPVVLLMSLFVIDFNGSYVFGLVGALIGFVTGNVLNLSEASSRSERK